MHFVTKEQLKTMFPQLTDSQAEYLSSLKEDINTIITRIMDNNIEPLHLNVKELAVSINCKKKFKKEYNYPEIFNHFYHQGDYLNEREKANELFEKVQDLRQKAMKYPNCAVEYNSEADKVKEKAEIYNRKAALFIMKKSMDKDGIIDVHGLYVKECLDFLDDLYLHKKFEKISIATGQKYNSAKLRPAVEDWLKVRGFMVIDEGPLVVGIKRKYDFK